ncbi:MAG TPA: tyrosine-type recombinase/integrase [Chitinophagales bacterium]|nr:tyrosine-type recombinase/integrase [Chitinophagales bacterium]
MTYKIWLNRFLEVCGTKPLEAYTVSDFVKYNGWLEGRYNPYTVQFATIVIKNFLSFCKAQNYACVSPTLIRLPTVSAKSHRAVTPEEFNRIVAEIPSKGFLPLRDTVIIRMLWDTGVRVSELCNLDVSQIDDTKRTTVIQTKKRGKKRVIVWSEETHALLIRYMEERLRLDKCKQLSALFVGWMKNEQWSTRLNTRSVQRIIKHYADRAGIKVKVTPHSFRHGWAHVRRDRNAPLAFIQRGLGHVSPLSTFVYQQYNDEEFERNADGYLKAA